MEYSDAGTEAALDESLEDLYEHAPCGYLSTLPDGSIVRVNETLLRWTGYGREELVGRRRFIDLLTPGGRIYHETHYAPLLQMQHAVREIALEILCADGSRLPVLVTSLLREDAGGRPLAIRTTVFDATDRKAYERELLRARERERTARQRTERLQRVTAALAAAHEPPQIAAAVMDSIVAGIGADEAVFAVLKGGGQRLDVLESRGSSPAVVDAWVRLGLRVDLPLAAVLASGEPCFVENPPAGVPVVRPAAVLAVVPLMLDRQPVGFIMLAFSESPRIGEEERALVVAVARQAAQALERAWLYEQTRSAARRSGLLAEAAHALNQAGGVTARAQVLVEHVVPALADAACVEIFDEDGPRTIAVAAVDEAARKGILGLGRVDAGATALPLRARGRRVGSLILSAAHECSEDRDESLLGELAARTALALENARLYERELRIAHVMQRSLLAGEPPRDPRFTVATRYQPGDEALEVGGDWYDAFAIGAGRLGLVVGDVVGRGLEAASAMGQLRSALRALTGAETSPGELLDRLERFVEHFDVGLAATVAVADIELETGTMRYACAGHLPPVLIQPGAPPELLWDGRSPPLGAFRGRGPRPEAEVGLRPGARLVLYTDGLIERRGRAMDDGLAELLGELAGRGPATPQQLVDELAVALVDPQDATDDVCLLCLAFGQA